MHAPLTTATLRAAVLCALLTLGGCTTPTETSRPAESPRDHTTDLARNSESRDATATCPAEGLGTDGSDHEIGITLGTVCGTSTGGVVMTDGGLAVVAVDQYLRWYDPGTGSVARSVSLGGDAYGVAISGGGAIAVVGAFGVSVYGTDGGRRWNAATVEGSVPGASSRVDIATDGTVAVLLSTGTVKVFGVAGQPGATVSLSNSRTDVAVSSELGLFFVCGFTQATSILQIPWIHAYSLSGTRVWSDYNQKVDGLGADTRCDVLSVGADGVLCMAGEQAGGGSPFERDPQDPTTSVANGGPSPDAHQKTYNLNGAAHITYVARFNGTTGAWLAGTHLVGRLSTGKGNGMTPTALAQDKNGLVYMAGGMAHAVAYPGEVTVGGTLMPNNGTYIAIFTREFCRLLWVTLGTGGNVTGVSAAGAECAIATSEAGAGVLTDATAGPGAWLGVLPLGALSVSVRVVP